MELRSLLIIGALVASTLAGVEDYNPRGYFNFDVTHTTWGHDASTDKKQLFSLRNDSLNMLDVMVGWGKLNYTTNPGPFLIIVERPTDTESSISFAQYLGNVQKHNKNLKLSDRKGVKFHFNDQNAVVQGFQLIQDDYRRYPTQLQFPIWISANILPGFGSDSTRLNVDGKELINLQKRSYPLATLSLGWDTNFGVGGSYTRSNFNEMVTLLKEAGSTAPLSFPLRAQFALKSEANDILTLLLNNSEIGAMSPSLILWEDVRDPKVTKQEVDEFIKKIGGNRVFVDLPHSGIVYVNDDGNGGGGGGPGDGGNGSGVKPIVSGAIVAAGLLLFSFLS